jgi:catechol 2,3-dioxygenase-like lactoylglutathione lyase family enzyme
MAVGPLGQVHISVRDVDQAIEFYRDVLGIPFLFRVPGQPMAFFQSGDVRLYLGTPERPEFASKCVLYFRVSDVDAEYDRLTAAGVAFLDRPHLVHREETTELWMVFLTDADGHQIGLMEDRLIG